MANMDVETVPISRSFIDISAQHKDHKSKKIQGTALNSHVV